MQPGAYLEMRYVRINQSGKGFLRPANPLYEGITPSGLVRAVHVCVYDPREVIRGLTFGITNQVREYRGSSIYFEPDATGGVFVGVLFDDDQGSPEVRLD